MTTKKIKSKSSATKSGKKTLVHASGDQCFWANDGKIITNIVELRDALSKMDEVVFVHHVTKNKNDFADWVHHVLQDAELAVSIRSAKKPHTARLAVVRRLREYDI